MIVVKNSQLDQDTVAILSELLETEINAGAAYKLTKIVKELNEIIKDKTTLEVKIVQKYAKKDEEGKLIIPNDENGNPMPNSFEIEGSKEDFAKEMNDLYSVENTLRENKLTFESVGIAKISPLKLMKISFLFDEEAA